MLKNLFFIRNVLFLSTQCMMSQIYLKNKQRKEEQEEFSASTLGFFRRL